jgi:hypothetical protein
MKRYGITEPQSSLVNCPCISGVNSDLKQEFVRASCHNEGKAITWKIFVGNGGFHCFDY